MASVSMAMSLTCSSHKGLQQLPSSEAFYKPLSVRPSKKSVGVDSAKPRARFEVEASLKGKAIMGLTVVALTASMMIPEVAEAAGPGITPSLNNFLRSIASGGVVPIVIVGAVIGVANFDPVKRS